MNNQLVTIKVESNIGEDGPLTVADTLHQFLDAFEFLATAISHEDDGKTIQWRLVGMTKNSPATATAEAYSTDDSIDVGPLVSRGKKRFSDGIADLSNGKVPAWLGENSRVAKALFKRNLNGVGKTVFILNDDGPQTVLVEKSSRQGLRAIEKSEADKKDAIEDLSHSERGSLEANVAEAKTYRGQPALYVKDRLSGKIIPCILTEKAASEAGPTHSWHDTWSGKRVRIKGLIKYDKSGNISQISASKVSDVISTPVDIQEMKKIEIIADNTPVQHLDEYWGYENG